MPAIYQYQNRATLIRVAQNLVQAIGMTNPIFQYVFPIVPRDTVNIRWIIKDNFQGLMALRGAGGQPVRRNPVGQTVRETTPGVFGEFMVLDEIELLKIGAGANQSAIDIPIDIAGRITDDQTALLTAEENRMRQMAWLLARTGALTVPLPGGGIGYAESFTPQSRTVSPLWTSKTTATPLSDLFGQQQLYGVGSSNMFGFNSILILNTYTSQLLYTNRNAADWGGQRSSGGGTYQGAKDYNTVRTDLMLPELVIWDGGYIDEAGSFQLDIPNGEALHVARRADGEFPGEFQLTYNAISKAPGAYTMVKDFSRGGPTQQEIPPRIETHAGFNGGLMVSRATQFVRLVVG